MLRGRSGKGHWWGVVLDSPDPQALGLFYAEMLGWEIYKNKPTEFVLAVPGDCEAYMSFQPQTSAEWVRPVWPARDGHQQMMMHLDVEVGELEVASPTPSTWALVPPIINHRRTFVCSTTRPGTRSACTWVTELPGTQIRRR